jgi:hypothetical protein
MPGAGGDDRAGGGVAGSHPSSGVGTASIVTGEAGAVREREVKPPVAGRLSAPAQEILGPAHVGAGYFCATVGVVDEKTIMEYIENQKWDDDAESFKITEPTKP